MQKFAIQSILSFHLFRKFLRNFHFLERKLFSVRKVSQIGKRSFNGHTSFESQTVTGNSKHT